MLDYPSYNGYDDELIPEWTRREEKHIWTAHQITDQSLLLEHPDHKNVYMRGYHCLACAYSDVVSKYGGDVDLRGLHRYHKCYEFLRMLVMNWRQGLTE